MSTYLLYNRQTPGERLMQTLAERLKPLQVTAELLDADSPRGVQLAEHYDIMARPAVLVVRDDGTLVESWDDPEQLPAPPDIAYLATQ